jgi:hypothetical protein
MNNIIKKAICCAIIFSITTNGFSQSSDASKMEDIIERAKQGDAEAQFVSGCFFYRGVGGDQDYFLACEFFTSSANQGHAKAQYMLGSCYSDGIGLKKDNRKAFHWFNKSAMQGDPDGQYAVATAFFRGNGTEQDFQKAVQWAQKSAIQGTADAQYLLALCYASGHGVSTDLERAKLWLTKASLQGHKEASDLLDSIKTEQSKSTPKKPKAEIDASNPPDIRIGDSFAYVLQTLGSPNVDCPLPNGRHALFYSTGEIYFQDEKVTSVSMVTKKSSRDGSADDSTTLPRQTAPIIRDSEPEEYKTVLEFLTWKYEESHISTASDQNTVVSKYFDMTAIYDDFQSECQQRGLVGKFSKTEIMKLLRLQITQPTVCSPITVLDKATTQEQGYTRVHIRFNSKPTEATIDPNLEKQIRAIFRQSPNPQNDIKRIMPNIPNSALISDESLIVYFKNKAKHQPPPIHDYEFVIDQKTGKIIQWFVLFDGTGDRKNLFTQFIDNYMMLKKTS